MLKRVNIIYLMALVILMISCSSGLLTRSSRLTITFDTDGGSTIPPLYVLANADPIQTPSSPTKDGFIFGGWYEDPEKTTLSVFPYTVIANKTFYANWINQSEAFTITFDTDGGSTIEPLYVLENAAPIQTPPSPTKDGFIFDGWYEDSEKTTLSVFPYTVTANKTFYANWLRETVTFTITFNTDGGNTIEPLYVLENAAPIQTPASPTKDGFIFDGWYEDPEKTILSVFPYTVTANKTFYANWVPETITFTITFNTDGGSTIEPITGDDGTSITLPTPSKGGYGFIGWYVGNVKVDSPYRLTATVTVLAKWEKLYVHPNPDVQKALVAFNGGDTNLLFMRDYQYYGEVEAPMDDAEIHYFHYFIKGDSHLQNGSTGNNSTQSKYIFMDFGSGKDKNGNAVDKKRHTVYGGNLKRSDMPYLYELYTNPDSDPYYVPNDYAYYQMDFDKYYVAIAGTNNGLYQERDSGIKAMLAFMKFEELSNSSSNPDNYLTIVYKILPMKTPNDILTLDRLDNTDSNSILIIGEGARWRPEGWYGRWGLWIRSQLTMILRGQGYWGGNGIYITDDSTTIDIPYARIKLKRSYINP